MSPKKKTAPESQTKEPQPMEIDVKVHSISTSGSTLARASVTLGGCFAVRGIKIMNSTKGPFVSMPGYQTQKGYKDVCFPCTTDFHQRFQETVLAAYRQELAQINTPRTYERSHQREAPGPSGAPEARAAPAPVASEAPPGPEEEAPEEGPAFGNMTM